MKKTTTTKKTIRAKYVKRHMHAVHSIHLIYFDLRMRFDRMQCEIKKKEKKKDKRGGVCRIF